MKNKAIILFIVLCGLAVTLRAQSGIFEKYAEMENVTSVYVSKSMMQMIPAMVGNVRLETDSIKNKLESLQLLSSSNSEKIALIKKDFKNSLSKNHEELMKIRDDGTRIDFYALKNGDEIRELIMLYESDSAYTVIQLLGKFSLSDVQGIVK